VLVIVATYCERENLTPLIERVLSLPRALELLVVDDNSPDGTGEIAEAWRTWNAAVHVLHRARKEGLGPALSAGFEWARRGGYDFVVNLDGDLSHNPSDIPRLLRALQDEGGSNNGSPVGPPPELAIGSRYIDGIRILNWPAHRLGLSLLAAHYVRWVTGMSLWDPTSGFRCFGRRALDCLLEQPFASRGYGFHIEAAHRVWLSGLQIAEVPIIFTDRAKGKTKICRSIVLEAAWLTCRLGLRGFAHRKGGAARRETLCPSGSRLSHENPL
jgi:dolichol-phosphate mannosyltransferase